jgi:hypothetical protein
MGMRRLKGDTALLKKINIGEAKRNAEVSSKQQIISASRQKQETDGISQNGGSEAFIMTSGRSEMECVAAEGIVGARR